MTGPKKGYRRTAIDVPIDMYWQILEFGAWQVRRREFSNHHGMIQRTIRAALESYLAAQVDDQGRAFWPPGGSEGPRLDAPATLRQKQKANASSIDDAALKLAERLRAEQEKNGRLNEAVDALSREPGRGPFTGDAILDPEAQDITDREPGSDDDLGEEQEDLL